MATIVTVHGTFAHVDETTGGKIPGGTTPAADLQWWEAGSTFAKDMAALVASAPAGGQLGGTPGSQIGPVQIEPFSWSGDNSELGRRAASADLQSRLAKLEARQEAYCIVAHSHGGTVVASALLQSAAQQTPLPGLKRWITVGSPFVTLRPMPWLFERLSLIRKVILVASIMLLGMFLMYLAGQAFGKNPVIVAAPSNGASEWGNVISALVMSVPAVVVTGIFLFLDRRALKFYRTSAVDRARQAYASKWTPLCHANDEAVQGLASLPRASLQIFDPAFAAQRLTMLAVFALPLAYLTLVLSPPLMVGITNFLRDHVYQVDKNVARETAYVREREKVNGVLRERKATRGLQADNLPDIETLRRQRQELEARYPDHKAISRALRFKREFLTGNGKPCAGNTLCGGGHSFAENTGLLFHIATDDLASAIVGTNMQLGQFGTVAVRAAIPLLLVPMAFILIALLFMLAIRLVAHVVSLLLSRLLNRVTLAEIKREIYGNDTDGEIAVGAGPAPAWIATGAPYLQAPLADRITDAANTVTASSLVKFRNAISILALTEGRPRDASIVSSYLTWKELIHTTYFELPEFRKLVAQAVVTSEGFAPSQAFAADPDFQTTATWLKGLAAQPGQQPKSGT